VARGVNTRLMNANVSFSDAAAFVRRGDLIVADGDTFPGFISVVYQSKIKDVPFHIL
jgi:hypothetical protein